MRARGRGPALTDVPRHPAGLQNDRARGRAASRCEPDVRNAVTADILQGVGNYRRLQLIESDITFLVRALPARAIPPHPC